MSDIQTAPANPKNTVSQSTALNNTSPQDSANETQKLRFAIGGMTCQSCATRVEKVLNKKPAIELASVNYATETLNISYDEAQVTPDQIMDWVTKTGFTATVLNQQDSGMGSLGSQPVKPDASLIILFICLLPFLVGMAGMLLGQGMAWMIPVWLQFLLATFVQFFLAIPFYKSAWASVRGGLANMDVLVVIGTVTIWLYSTYMWLSQSITSAGLDWTNLLYPIYDNVSHVPVYFEAGVMIIAFVRLGKYLEARTKKQSLNSINLLLELTPDTVEKRIAKDNIANTVIKSEVDSKPKKPVNEQLSNAQPVNNDAEFIETALKEIVIADEIRSKQGSRIATDGVVIEGTGWCNESHLTGESVAVKKQAGDKVLAGALVDNGSLIYKVTAKGQDTQLSDMVQALSEAQGSKANLARLADKVAAVFVPVVVAIALLTFAVTWWITGQIDMAIMHAVSVLVIACPCALGLATPAAIMAGMGVAARHGVWFKDAQSLEAAGDIDIVVFDKTGTLTVGRPQVVSNMMQDNSIDANEVLQLCASVEAHTSHPIATALVKAAQYKNLPLLNVKEVDAVLGQGVQAHVEGYGQVKVGKPEFADMTLPPRLPKIWNIASIVAVSVNGVALGMFALSDDIKQDSKSAVEDLLNKDINVILLSGDKPSTVSYVAEQLGIKNVAAEMSPRAKANYIKEIQDKDYKVAMVGDGVNDAPAMATADASFAMVEGTDVARYSASARLMGESLHHVNSGLNIADATVRNIKQNLFFAFIYNCLGIPLAALGYLNPMIAAAAMALSSISVLSNALRLTRYSDKRGYAEQKKSTSNDQTAQKSV